ncbi:carboxypeptidase-like regulatory domain-containing protein [Nocardioides sp. URHA0020]|uniref:carboxypeptidase-like regulatory domain-containing protein n=1 Tax=Nocardioides sp. URHA0020 TaxID=1380392 RepID=UPI00048D9570|nr:carboxypeptidase-like regulatory domain-containing protein [Nocardioides sp. URHA0020]
MPHRRVVASLVLLLAVGIVAHGVPGAAAHTSPAASADAEPTSSLRLVPTKPEPGTGWIQGTVVDRAGRLLDGVDVEAYDVRDLREDPDADPVANWQTYEHPQGGPEHGWFRLYDLAPGTYKVKITSPSGTPKKERYRTLWTKPVKVGKGSIVRLGPTAITLVNRVPAKLTVQVVDARVKTGQSPRLKLRLSSADVRAITGSVRVRVDRQRVRLATLKASHQGRLTVTLPRQALGRHEVAVTFAGNSAVAASSKPVVVTFKVTRNGR